MSYIRITRGAPGSLNDEGLEVLRTALWKDGKEIDHIPTYSGAPGAQNFRTLANEKRGFYEPIPEGTYRNVGGLEWAGGADNYETYWSSSLGPVVIEVYGERAIMLHLDANREYAPGSAGCICPINLAGLKKVVKWWREHKIEYVECDWGLGTIKRSVEVNKTNKVKFFYNDGKMKAYKNDEVVEALEFKLDYHSNKLGIAVNKASVSSDKIKNIQVIVMYE